MRVLILTLLFSLSSMAQESSQRSIRDRLATATPEQVLEILFVSSSPVITNVQISTPQDFYDVANYAFELNLFRYQGYLTHEQKIEIIRHAKHLGFDIINDPYSKIDSFEKPGIDGVICAVFANVKKDTAGTLEILKEIAVEKPLSEVRCGQDDLDSWSDKAISYHQAEVKRRPLEEMYKQRVRDWQNIKGLYAVESKKHLDSLTTQNKQQFIGDNSLYELTEGMSLAINDESDSCNTDLLVEDLSFMSKVLRRQAIKGSQSFSLINDNCSRRYILSSDVVLNSNTKAEVHKKLNEINFETESLQ